MKRLVITSLLAVSAITAQAKDIVETADAAGDFKTLTTALQAAGLVDTLKGAGPYTVFAPTDAAFAKVPKATLSKVASDPVLLKKVLLYHVVKGNVTAAQASMLTSAKTLEGASVPIRVSGTKVYVGGAQVVKADVKASNGVIHVVNKVLIPAS